MSNACLNWIFCKAFTWAEQLSANSRMILVCLACSVCTLTCQNHKPDKSTSWTVLCVLSTACDIGTRVYVHYTSNKWLHVGNLCQTSAITLSGKLHCRLDCGKSGPQLALEQQCIWCLLWVVAWGVVRYAKRNLGRNARASTNAVGRCWSSLQLWTFEQNALQRHWWQDEMEWMAMRDVFSLPEVAKFFLKWTVSRCPN